MVTFNRIELNKETNCLEAYLEGETDARTDIPFDSQCIASLILLLLHEAMLLIEDEVKNT